MKLVRAGLADRFTSLTEDAWHAVARAAVSPSGLATQLRSQSTLPSAMIEEHVNGATLFSLYARTWLTELFPGLQPRTGQEALPVPDPTVEGALNGPVPAATTVYRYRSQEHLRDHLRQTIAQTRELNRQKYDHSILARRITRAVLAHPGRLEFDDGTEPVHVMLVRDGITRLTSSWALLAPDGADAQTIAEASCEVLLAQKPTRRGVASKALSQQMAVGRQGKLVEMHEAFSRGVLSDHPADRSVRLGQTLTVPAQITVGVRSHEVNGLPAKEVFDDAVRSILASVHVEFSPWEDAAQNVEVGSRALKRVQWAGSAGRHGVGADLSDVVDLALGRRGPRDLADVFDTDIPATPLWRAVYLVHALTRPAVFGRVKAEAKHIKGTKRMTNAGYAELLGPMVDLPWRAAKRNLLRQARNAWANGGVLTDEVRGEWQPTPHEDFTALVGPALQGDDNARLTLVTAGGIALIADKLLTRNVGSAVGRTVPYRADVNAVVADLGRRDNPEGLWLLALAAARFQADGKAQNSYTDKQLKAVGPKGMYVIPDVDLAQPDRIRRDPGGLAERPLTQYEVTRIADPERAAREEVNRREAGRSSREPDVAELLAQQQRRLRGHLTDARQALEALQNIRNDPATGTLSLLGSEDDAQQLNKLAQELSARIFNIISAEFDEEPEPEPENDDVET
ncbi:MULTISPECIES: hypothetical protein [unclassified Streptomyces]|uniref:hypothetical protein n=1 Tax=unclassified Streptomyces TaxID=2593676 RepID=UPI0022B5E65D|nr:MULTISPECIES: hypothetical protein [unclassified Streptomyces]MCZ7414870.1 hypothetical protein [Streptomyces sp. WMMC897]MCZ7431813.1 hypothetical protein [Streptomyces sp. WMMC1477]